MEGLGRIAVLVFVLLFLVSFLPYLGFSKAPNPNQDWPQLKPMVKIGIVWNTQDPLKANITLLDHLERELVAGIEFSVYPSNEILLQEVFRGKVDIGIVQQTAFSEYAALLPQPPTEKIEITLVASTTASELIALTSKNFAYHYPTLTSISKDIFQSLSETELAGLIGKPLPHPMAW